MRAYDAHSDAIFRHCYFRLFNRERARELTQETFMKTWEQITKGVEIRNVKAFLYRTATNLIIDDTRRKKTDSLDVLQENGFNPSFENEENIFNAIEMGRVKIALEKLDEKYRSVIVMRYMQDLTIKEIAEVLGISVNVISVRLHRGLKELKKILTYGHEEQY